MLERQSVAILAPLLLGELGKQMAGMDRSHLPYDIRFHSKPTAWYGLCQIDWITLNLESPHRAGGSADAGYLRIGSVTASPRFKITPFIYQPLDAPRERQAEISCAASTDAKDFFPAPDRLRAYDAAYLFDYVRGAGPFAGSRYKLSCTGNCNGIDVQAYLRTLRASEITLISTIDCPPGSGDTSCLKFSLTGSPPGLFPREMRVFGQNRRENTTVREVRLWIGTTMF